MLLFSLLLLCAGCGQEHVAATAPAVALTGRVHGAQQAVSGASISLYAAGSVGHGLGSVNLLTSAVITDGNGGFSIAGDYTCPTASTQVYLVARGGSPGLPGNTTNPALVLMTALGDCGALSASSFIFINELTTAASAWALAQFLAPGAAVGASVTNASGLRNAFLAAGNLANASNGLAPGPSLPAGASTETAKLYTLANVLSSCVHSDGTSECTPLFAAAGGSVSNTLDAALAIVLNPGVRVANVFNATPAGGPFQPALASLPNDWTMSVTFGGCAAGCGGLDLPGALAIDSSGNVWVANYANAAVSKFSSSGLPAAANGFPGAGLRESYGIAIDPQDNAWVTNLQSVTAANNSHLGSISRFSATGAELSGAGYTAGGIYYPEAVAVDSAGTVWVANHGNSSATLLANNGSAISTGGYAVSALPFTSSAAIDALHNAWFAIQTGVARVTAAGTVSSYTCCDNPSGIAIDASGNVWVADYGAASVVRLNASGAVLNTTTLGGGLLAPELLAVDGGGNVWTSNYRGNSVSQLAAGNAAVLSPVLGFGLDAPLNEPYGIAVDASGNLWISNSNSNTITEFVGLAQPVQTPLLGPPAQP